MFRSSTTSRIHACIAAATIAIVPAVHAQATRASVATAPLAQVAGFRGGPTHAGVSTASGVGAPGGLLWRVQTSGPVRSSPTIAGDAVYVGSGDGSLYAFDLRTGRERWRVDAGTAVSSSPAVTAAAVYATTLGNTILAVSRRDGRVLWRAETGPDVPLAWGHEGNDYYASSPVVAGGLVIAGSGDGHVYALDATTGRRRWRVRTGGRVRASPAVAGGIVYVGSFDGIVYALDAATGQERWRYATEGTTLRSADFGYDRRSIQSSPAVVDGVVYIGARDGHLYALGAADGRLRWRNAHDETSWSIGSPSVRDSTVFEGSSDAHFFHALRTSDGTERWRVPAEHSVWASPIVAGSLVYLAEGAYDASGLGTIRALDAATGAERWRYRTGAGVLSSPALGDGVLVVGSDDGGVYALRAGERALERVVFWDSLAVPGGFVRDHRAVRDYLGQRGYGVVDAAGLRDWMTARIADRAPSVAVFAIDYAPRIIAGASADTVLLRRYLDAGGTVVWLGLPPRMWVPDSTGHRTLAGFGGRGTEAVLGVRLAVNPWDGFGARPTAAGRRRGFSGWWIASYASPVPPNVELLATDERGYAVAWSRRFGGAPGTGFIQVGRSQWDTAALRELAAIAEYRPDRD